MSSFGKFVGAVALLALGIVGLAMSLCGGVFTFVGVTTRTMSGVLAISIPSLLAGLAVAWFTIRRFLAHIRKHEDAKRDAQG